MHACIWSEKLIYYPPSPSSFSAMSTVGDAYEDDMFEDANSGSFDVQEEHSPPHERHSCGTALPRSAAADMMNTLRSYEASPFPVHQ